MTSAVQKILSYYESDNPGTKANLYRMLMHGTLSGTGKMVILPVDQGTEHGPARSFSVNPAGYDPHYHFKLAIESGCNAYAAPLGMIEAGASTFAGQVPTILKMNSANSLSRLKEDADQAVTASIGDALRLGCAAIGFTIYPGSDAVYGQMEEIRELIEEAKAVGIASVVWSYPRGGNVSKIGETSLDVVAYGAHLACQLGAHIIKVKLPTGDIEQLEAKQAFEKGGIKVDTLADRVREVVRSCYNGRRIVVFSGGNAKGADSVLDDARAIQAGGGNGSIMGRNAFQRPWDESLKLLSDVMAIYKK